MNTLEQQYEKKAKVLDRLYDAIEAGDLPHVQKFAEKHAELLTLPRYGCAEEESLLHIAAANGHTEICRLLVSHGLDLDQPFIDQGHETALSYAAGEGHVQTCRWLLDAGARVDGWPNSVVTPLISAVIFEQLETAELLLSKGADVNRLHQRFNRAPLDLAVDAEGAEIVALLKAHGAHSISELTQEESPGEPIVTFVHNTAGWVLPAVFSPTCDDARAQLRISLIDGKDAFKLLFTVGLFEQSPMTELFLCLPADWPLPRQGLEPGSALRFPVEVLSRLARHTFEHGALREGDLVRRSDPAFADLAWPDAVDALLVIDKPWNKDPQPAPIPDDEKVWLYLLAPVKYTAKGEPQGAALATLVERKKAASWKALALKA